MPAWSSGVTWSSGALWGPATGPDPFQNRNRNRNGHTNMKRKNFFPTRISERPEWFHKLATQLLVVNPVLGVDTTTLNARVADALYCEYLCGPWLTWARGNGEAATAAVETLFRGESEGAFDPPVFTPPPLPPGDATATPPIPATVAVPAGALLRLFDFIANIKRMPTYTEDIGHQLGIIGEEDTVVKELPEFTLKVTREDACECVKIAFKKFGHQGVMIWSRRAGGEWEKLGIDLNSPYMDERPLLNPAQPEAREYRLQFYDDDTASGPFTPVQGTTVNP